MFKTVTRSLLPHGFITPFLGISGRFREERMLESSFPSFLPSSSFLFYVIVSKGRQAAGSGIPRAELLLKPLEIDGAYLYGYVCTYSWSGFYPFIRRAAQMAGHSQVLFCFFFFLKPLKSYLK